MGKGEKVAEKNHFQVVHEGVTRKITLWFPKEGQLQK